MLTPSTYSAASKQNYLTSHGCWRLVAYIFWQTVAHTEHLLLTCLCFDVQHTFLPFLSTASPRLFLYCTLTSHTPHWTLPKKMCYCTIFPTSFAFGLVLSCIMLNEVKVPIWLTKHCFLLYQRVHIFTFCLHWTGLVNYIALNCMWIACMMELIYRTYDLGQRVIIL